MTLEQLAKVEELEKKGWVTQTPPEAIWNGALLMEGGDDGASYYVHPDGTVNQKC